jgi:hypothetical protein
MTIEPYQGSNQARLINSHICSGLTFLRYDAFFFFDYKKGIHESFAQVFGGSSEGKPIEAEFSEKWSWYHFVSTLAQEDITKIDKVTKLPITQTLTHTAYLQDKSNLNDHV